MIKGMSKYQRLAFPTLLREILLSQDIDKDHWGKGGRKKIIWGNVPLNKTNQRSLLPSPFHSLQSTNPWDGATHSQGASSLLCSTSLQTHLGLCFHDDCKPHQNESEDQLSPQSHVVFGVYSPSLSAQISRTLKGLSISCQEQAAESIIHWKEHLVLKRTLNTPKKVEAITNFRACNQKMCNKTP